MSQSWHPTCGYCGDCLACELAMLRVRGLRRRWHEHAPDFGDRETRPLWVIAMQTRAIGAGQSPSDASMVSA